MWPRSDGLASVAPPKRCALERTTRRLPRVPLAPAYAQAPAMACGLLFCLGEAIDERCARRDQAMTTTTLYPIAGYPTVYLTRDGAQMTIHPMVPEDEAALLDFFRRI